MVAYLFEDPDVAFVRVPKTGSSSILQAFFRQKPKAKWDGCLPPKDVWNYDRSFAVVRNPIDRMRSCVAMFTARGHAPEYDCPKGWQTPTVEQIIELVAYGGVRPSKTGYLNVLKMHAIPQTHPYFALECVDRLFLFEDVFVDGWAKIADFLGVLEPEQLHINASKNLRSFTLEQERMIKEFYAADFELLSRMQE